MRAFALFALTCLVYARSPFNGFIWDDPAYVVENSALRSADGLLAIWTRTSATPQYYPAVHTSFWVEAHLWGQTNPAGFHVDNVLLHAIAAVLLWRAFVALAVPWPLFAAAAFAVHPVTVESVSWITERKNVLSLVFYLLAFHAYQRFRWPGHSSGQAVRRTRLWYAASLGLFLLALLSKTVTCSLPAAILLIAYWKRGRVARADVRPLVPMFVLGLGLAALTGYLERTQVGAAGNDFDLSFAQRTLIAGRVVFFYAGKLAWPSGLLFMYPRWAVDPHQLWQWAYPAAAVAVVAALFYSRRRLGRGPLVAVLVFAGTLTPALGFVNVYPMRYSFVADHFQYLAAIGLVPLYVAAIASVVGRLRLPRSAYVRPAIATAILAPLAWLTWRQQSIYADRFTLWTDTLRRNPGSWMARLNLAAELRDRGDPAAALAQTLTALREAPDEADPHYDYGKALVAREDWPGAIAEYRRATELGPNVPATWDALAGVLWVHGTGPADQVAAERAAETAVALRPDSADAEHVLSEYAAAIGDRAGAVAHAERAAAAAGDTRASLHLRLGDALMNVGRFADAAAAYNHALAIDPNDPAVWTFYGFAADRSGHPNDAAAAFGRALKIDPHYAPAKQALSQLKRAPA